MIERSGETEKHNRFLEVFFFIHCVTQLGVYIEEGRGKIEEDRLNIRRQSCVMVDYRSLIGPHRCGELAVVTQMSRVT